MRVSHAHPSGARTMRSGSRRDSPHLRVSQSGKKGVKFGMWHSREASSHS
jgi:hypothetical protein